MRYRLLFCLLALPLTAIAARADEFRGRVVGVDLDRKEMTVQGVGRHRGAEYRFRLDEKTRVMLGSQPGTLTDLRGARRARVEFEDRDGQNVARLIRVPGPLPALGGILPPAAAAPDANAVTGTLRRVSQAEREIVVIGAGSRDAESETTVSVPEGTAIRKDGKKIGLDGLKEGDPVTVQVDRKGGQAVARSIQVGPAATTMAAPAAPQDPIPRVRRVLQMVDQILAQMEQRPPRPRTPPPPPPDDR